MKRFLGLIFLLGSYGLQAATDFATYLDLINNPSSNLADIKVKLQAVNPDGSSDATNLAIVELLANRLGYDYKMFIINRFEEKAKLLINTLDSAIVAQEVALEYAGVDLESDLSSPDLSDYSGSVSPVSMPSSEDMSDYSDGEEPVYTNLNIVMNSSGLDTHEQVQKGLLNNVAILERLDLYPGVVYKELLDSNIARKQQFLLPAEYLKPAGITKMVDYLVAIGYTTDDLTLIVTNSNEDVSPAAPAVAAVPAEPVSMPIVEAPSEPVIEPVSETPAIITPSEPVAVSTPSEPVSEPVIAPSVPALVPSEPVLVSTPSVPVVAPVVSAPSAPVVSAAPVAVSPSDTTWKVPNFDEDQYEDINSTAKQIIKYVIENSPTLRLLTDAEIQTIAKTTAAAKLMGVSQLIKQDKSAQEVVNFLRTSKSILPNTEPVAIPVAPAASEPVVSATPVAMPVVAGPNAQVILDKLGSSITPAQKTALIAHEAELTPYLPMASLPVVTPDMLKNILVPANMLNMPAASVAPAGAGAGLAAPAASASTGVAGSNAQALKTAGITDLSGFSEEELGKYSRMLKMGVPLLAVQQKMVQDRPAAGSSGSGSLLSSIAAGKALTAVGLPTTTLPEVAAPIDPKLQEKISFIKSDIRLQENFGVRLGLLRDLSMDDLNKIKQLKQVPFGKISAAIGTKSNSDQAILAIIRKEIDKAQAPAAITTPTVAPVAQPLPAAKMGGLPLPGLSKVYTATHGDDDEDSDEEDFSDDESPFAPVTTVPLTLKQKAINKLGGQITQEQKEALNLKPDSYFEQFAYEINSNNTIVLPGRLKQKLIDAHAFSSAAPVAAAPMAGAGAATSESVAPAVDRASNALVLKKVAKKLGITQGYKNTNLLKKADQDLAALGILELLTAEERALESEEGIVPLASATEKTRLTKALEDAGAFNLLKNFSKKVTI